MAIAFIVLETINLRIALRKHVFVVEAERTEVAHVNIKNMSYFVRMPKSSPSNKQILWPSVIIMMGLFF